MRITRLNIRNFRMLRDLNLEDLKGVNVLIGPNATGKSTVLEALHQLLKANALSVTREDGFRSMPGAMVSLDATISLTEEDVAEALLDTAVALSLSDPQADIVKKFAGLLEGEIHLGYEVRAPRTPSPSSVRRDMLVGKEDFRTFLAKHLPERDPWRGDSGISRAKLVEAFFNELEASLRERTMTLPVQRRMLSVFQAKRTRESSPATLGSRIVQARMEEDPWFLELQGDLRRFLPHTKDFQTTLDEEGRFVLGLTEEGLPGATSGDRWSSGTGHLALILGGLRALPEGAVMTVEEPELSLHPHALRRLMDEIRESSSRGRIQFFLSTHSPVAVEQLRPETEDHALWQLRRRSDGSAEAVPRVTDAEVAEAVDSLLRP